MRLIDPAGGSFVENCNDMSTSTMENVITSTGTLLRDTRTLGRSLDQSLYNNALKGLTEDVYL